MQLCISHDLAEELVLPIQYHHILQSVIYHNLREEHGYSGFLHEEGYASRDRQFRLFTFSLLQGRYSIQNRQIVFRNSVSFEVRSADVRMIRILQKNLETKGITYIKQHYENLQLKLSDRTIATDSVRIRMRSPICVYSTDPGSKKTYFYRPQEEAFSALLNANFHRKYKAFTGMEPGSDIKVRTVLVNDRDKYVTKYKGFYINGWFGEYELTGEPKYLDFLYQTGLGSKNAQGFGMFEIVES